jgi:hypothetical protein
MLHQHNNFLANNKARKARVVRIIRVFGDNMRSAGLPVNVACLGKQICHQRVLVGELNIDMTLPKPATATTHTIDLKTVDSRDSLAKVDKFNVAIQSLAGDAFHDDVNSLALLLSDEPGIATEEGQDLLTIDRIWNLAMG